MGQQLYGYALAAACFLLVLSLPFNGAEFARKLRRWAAFLFLAAIGPSIFFGLLKEAMPAGGPPTPVASTGSTNPLAVFGGFVLLSGAAYIFLKVRRLSSRKQRDAMGEFFTQRSSGKRPVERDDQGGGFPF